LLAFLLDAHVPAAVADGVRAIRPDCRIEHLSYWRGGVLRNALDEHILVATRNANLVLVTYDVGTIPAILRRWLAERRPIPGTALISTRAIAQNDVGGIVRAIVGLFDEPAVLDPAYPVVYLRPPP
jgi:hypothetical protein